MNKIFYNEYVLKLHGKQYEILIPKIPLEEAWVWPEVYINQEGTFVEGNRNLLQAAWDAAVTLTNYRNKIIYFPVRKIPPLRRFAGYEDNYDILFYNHQIQFKRKNWKELRNMMRYVKPKCYVVEYSLNDFLEASRERWERFRRSNQYYNRKSCIRRWVAYGTLFVEGSIDLFSEEVDLAYSFMQSDLEVEAADLRCWFPYTYILGVEWYFVTKEFHEKKWR